MYLFSFTHTHLKSSKGQQYSNHAAQRDHRACMVWTAGLALREKKKEGRGEAKKKKKKKGQFGRESLLTGRPKRTLQIFPVSRKTRALVLNTPS